MQLHFPQIKHTHTHHITSQCAPQYSPLSTHLHLQMFIAMSHWSGLRPLAPATPSILDPLRYPVAAVLCHEDPAALDLQEPALLHALVLNRWGRPAQSPGSGPRWQLSWSAHQLSCIHTTRVSSPALLWLGHPVPPLAGGRVSSPLVPSECLTRMHSSSTVELPSKGVGPLSHVLQTCEGLGQLSLLPHPWGGLTCVPHPQGKLLVAQAR